MDSPNRLNVALTRARYQLVIVGDCGYFTRQNQCEELKKLAEQTHRQENYEFNTCQIHTKSDRRCL